MQYALFYFEAPAEMAKRSDPAAADGYWAAWMGYMAMMREKGVIESGNALEPRAHGTTVRGGPDGRVIEDGAFADSREEFGGYVIVSVPDIDAAIELAGHAPCAASGAGHVAVVPVWQMQAAA